MSVPSVTLKHLLGSEGTLLHTELSAQGHRCPVYSLHRAQNTLSCVFFFSRKGSFQTFGKEVCITDHSVRTCPQPPVPPMGERGEMRVLGVALMEACACMGHLFVPISLCSVTSSLLAPPGTRHPRKSKSLFSDSPWLPASSSAP